MALSSSVLDRLLPGGAADLYAGLTAQPDPQGWFTNPQTVNAVVDLVRPGLIIEVGTWKGSSAIAMARRAKGGGMTPTILCIDTWLGSEEHWLTPDYREMLLMKNGRPQVYEVFRANVAAAELTDSIVPLCLPSAEAARVLTAHRLRADLIYIDAAHDHDSVLQDLSAYWPLLAPNGLMFGDDYPHPPVKSAVLAFAARQSLLVATHPAERSFAYARTRDQLEPLLAAGFVLEDAT